MAYQAEISRKNPGCFLFLVDQSESMEDPFGGGEAGRKKAEELATILNKLIHNLSIRCAKSDSIYDYFHVGERRGRFGAALQHPSFVDGRTIDRITGQRQQTAG